jgi:PAS domain S-box-containing protein
MRTARLFHHIATRVGGTRVLALPLIRVLAIVAGFTWVLLAPQAPGWTPVAAVMLGFLVYSATIMAVLWMRPPAILRLNVFVLLADLAFAVALIRLTGGVQSALYLALLLIAGLQSYYYGIMRGILVGAGSSALYVAVIWPTIGASDWANIAIRLVVLLGTAAGGGILADIEDTERRRVITLTAEAHEREQFIRNVVESLREGVVALDRDGRVLAWNAAMEQRYGISGPEVVGHNFFTFFPSIERESWSTALRQLLGGEIEQFTLEAVEHETLRTGRVIQNLKGSLLRQHGQPAGAVLLIEDITDQIGLERGARQSEKLAAVGTLAAGLAHELNNPIGIISSRIELMLLDAESQALSPQMREDLRVLHRHAQRVARIVQGLLSFARKSPASRGQVDLNQIVDETLLLIEKQVVKEGITLTRMLAPGLPSILGDANALQQVLMNLVVNARDAVEAGGEIVVQTDLAPTDPHAVRLSVRDTGPGIRRDILSKIFDPFFTTKPNGTGLGLAISYGIVREHQGAIDVQSSPGDGTAFTLTFPVTLVEVSV